MIRFYLHFKSDNYGLKEIEEPIGFASVDFQLKQEEGRYARDISFTGGEFEFEFCERLNHEFEALIYYNTTFGYESIIELIIDFGDGINTVIGELDFQNAKTDDYSYFKCKIIQDGKQALLKRRQDIKVDLMSDKTLDNEPITPLVPENILLKAKPILSKSKWSLPRVYNVPSPFSVSYFNFINKVDLYGIDDTLSYLQGFGSPDDMKYLFAKTDLHNVKIEIKNLDLLTNGFPTLLYYAIGIGTLAEADRILLQSVENDRFNSSFTINIPFIQRNSNVWIYFKCTGASGIYFNSGEINITATSIAYNTISPSFRLYDVIKYVTKSISEMNIDAPRFSNGSQFYDQRIVNGNFLRNIKDKGFHVTLNDIKKYLPELNGDIENKPTDELFVGLYEDYYTNNEVAFFSSNQFDSLEKTYNPRYAINEFNFKYKSYQSQKENSEENTYDDVHGESQWLLKNKLVENKKDVEIEFYRSAFLLEYNRRKGLEDSVSKANQDDDKICIIDTIELNEEDRNFTETSYLQHSYNPDTGENTLRNSGEFSFELLGIAVGTVFEILTYQNGGLHEVIEVGTNTITLIRTSPGVSSTNGNFTTRFKYYVDPSIANYTLWTDEGFSLIDGLENGTNYANLRFSEKRNINNFWSQYLASCNLYHKDDKIKNTFYKNNPNCETVYEGLQLKEGEEFLPKNPIITPVLYENVTLICDVEDFFEIQNKVRTLRGFIRFINNKGEVIKGYPKNMKYTLESRALICDLEEKYEPSLMTITTDISGIILINNETRLHKLKYKILDNNVYIYDENEELMYNPVYWEKISVNGAFASSKYELKTWLDLLV